MIAKEFLDLLCCPETRLPLLVAEPGVIEQLNNKIAAGQLRTRAGTAVAKPLESALLRTDGKVAYPIRDGIPVLLTDEGIVLS